MPQLQAEVPHPLCHQLPAFLAPGRVAAPAVGVLLGVFVCQCRLKGATMQVQRDDVRGGGGALRAVGKKEILDENRPRVAKTALFFAGSVRWPNPAGTYSPASPRDRWGTL